MAENDGKAIEEKLSRRTAAIGKTIIALGNESAVRDTEFLSKLQRQVGNYQVLASSYEHIDGKQILVSAAVLAWFPSNEQLDSILDLVIQQRAVRGDTAGPCRKMTSHPMAQRRRQRASREDQNQAPQSWPIADPAARKAHRAEATSEGTRVPAPTTGGHPLPPTTRAASQRGPV